MHTQQERPWPAIDLAELRFGIAFGSSVEELADSSMFLIRKGEVKIGAPSVDGHNTVFDVLGEGQIFGEIALLDGRPRSTDATAMTGCEFFVIDRRDFLPLLRGDPLIALGLIEMLCARLRRTSEQVEYVMSISYRAGSRTRCFDWPRALRIWVSTKSMSLNGISATSLECPAKARTSNCEIGNARSSCAGSAVASSYCQPRRLR